MKIDNTLPTDLQNLTRLMRQHAEKGSKTRCVQHEDDPNNWTIVTTEDPRDAARFARCLMGCKIKFDRDGAHTEIQSGKHTIRVIRADHLDISC